MEVVVTKWDDVANKKRKKNNFKILILFIFICIVVFLFLKSTIKDFTSSMFKGTDIYYMKGDTYCVIDDKIGKEEILNEDEFNKKAIINPHQTYFQTENDMVYYYDVDKKIVSLIAANSFVLQTDNIFNYNETMLMTKGEKVFYGTYDDVSKNTCTLYIKELDKPAVKIDNDVSIIYGAFSNENFIYYGNTQYEILISVIRKYFTVIHFAHWLFTFEHQTIWREYAFVRIQKLIADFCKSFTSYLLGINAS